MNSESEWSIPVEFLEFQDVFSNAGVDQLPSHSIWDHKIAMLEHQQSSCGPIDPLSPPEQRALREYLDQMIEIGNITPSSSLALAPMGFVPKKDGKL